MPAQFARYLLAGGLAALANYGSRFLFSEWVPFELAVVSAFVVGLSTGFVLMRCFAFRDSATPVEVQVFWYIAINLLALAQTVVISSVLLHIVLPALGVHHHAEAIAHATGIVTPLVSSYFGHKLLTFR